MNEILRAFFVLYTCLFVHCEHVSPHKISPDCRSFCERIDCEPVKECKDGIILDRGSYCGCCKACIKYLDNNEACTKLLTGSLALIAQSRCKPGTECLDGKCITVSEGTTECLRQKKIRETRNKSLYKENIWIPQCDMQGNFAAKQKKMRKSVCFDELGKRMFGNAEDTLENSCACSRHMQKKEKANPDAYNTEPQEHCSSSGSFAPVQCISNLCYCADINTGQVKSHLVSRNFLEKLPCYNENSQMKDYLTNCERELQRSRKLIYDFKRKGMKVVGIDRIKCDPDGTFSPRQCTPTNCICTDKAGVGIKSYHPDIKEIKGKNMTCYCAREENYQRNFMFRCTKFGNYEKSSCVGDHCVCVDEDGDIISEGPGLDDETCDKRLQALFENTADDDDYSTDDDYDDYKYLNI